jgi:glutamine phosphoribosylpyrophosphate amidotransferase
MNGLLDACGDPEDTHFCTACYTGEYPTAISNHAKTKTEREKELVRIIGV